MLLVPVVPLIAYWVSLVVLVVPLAWWLVIVVCWVVAACLLHYFSSLVMLDWGTPPNLQKNYHLFLKATILPSEFNILPYFTISNSCGRRKPTAMTTINNWHCQVNCRCTTVHQVPRGLHLCLKVIQGRCHLALHYMYLK